MKKIVQPLLAMLFLVFLTGCQTEISSLIMAEKYLQYEVHENGVTTKTGGIGPNSDEYQALLNWAQNNTDGWYSAWSDDVAPNLMLKAKTFTLNVWPDEVILTTNGEQYEKSISPEEFDMFQRNIFDLRH